MAKPYSPNTPNKYYFYNDATKIVWYSNNMPENSTDIIYIGTSDNPNPRMAAGIFMRNIDGGTGYRVKEWIE